MGFFNIGFLNPKSHTVMKSMYVNRTRPASIRFNLRWKYVLPIKIAVCAVARAANASRWNTVCLIVAPAQCVLIPNVLFGDHSSCSHLFLPALVPRARRVLQRFSLYHRSKWGLSRTCILFLGSLFPLVFCISILFFIIFSIFFRWFHYFCVFSIFSSLFLSHNRNLRLNMLYFDLCPIRYYCDSLMIQSCSKYPLMDTLALHRYKQKSETFSVPASLGSSSVTWICPTFW